MKTLVVEGHVAAHAASVWDDRYRAGLPRPRDWLELPYIHKNYINRAITGSPDLTWFTFACLHYLRPAERILEIGCGANGVGFDLCRLDVAQRVVGIDVSPEAIRVSRERIASTSLADRIDYRCEDVTTADLGEGAFDGVIVNMALHHVLELERLLANVRRCKKPESLFVINEYVGPNRFQWTDATLREGQRLLESLDERYRIHGVSGEVVRTFTRPPYEAMVEGDASEAIRSSAIEPLLATYFEQVDRRPYGGTILQWLLADIVANFDPEHRPKDAAELERLFDEERRLLRNGTLQSNFAVIVVR